MKKWAFTLLGILALLAASLTVKTWLPWLLGFAVTNQERIESLESLCELVSKIVLGIGAIGLFFLQLWKKPAPPPPAPQRVPEDLQIELVREIGGQVSKFTIKLNDLLTAPYGIANLLAEYQKEQTDELWQAIKKRAEANHQKLENLYGTLETLKGMGFLGQYADLLNQIDRVIDAKMNGLYFELARYPLAPKLTDSEAISDLLKMARAMWGSDAQIEKIRDKLSAYISENEEFLRQLLIGNVETKVH
jgi:hypothetical protein